MDCEESIDLDPARTDSVIVVPETEMPSYEDKNPDVNTDMKVEDPPRSVTDVAALPDGRRHTRPQPVTCQV